MIKLFKNKKVVILSIVLAVIILAGGILAWQLTKSSGTYTVKFETNGGNEIEAIEVEKGTVLSHEDLPVPSKRGELFLTWNTDEELTEPYWETSVEDDITLYASYVETVDDATINELAESFIPYADAALSLTVCSPFELTNDNIDEYIMLTVAYGRHKNGDEIKLSVTPEGEGIYRISGNYAAGGEYIISLISNDITFNPEDTVLKAYGLTDALRLLRFRIIGETYMEGELSDKVADIPENEIAMTDINMVTVSGKDRNLIGATVADNAIVLIGDGDDASNYYKILSVESTTDDGITYNVRRAELEEIYDRVSGYQWEDIDGEDFVIDEELKQQVMDEITANEELNNYVKYLAAASSYTPTYETMSMEKFGEVVQFIPTATLVTPVGITWGVDTKAYNKHFVDVIGYDKAQKFVKLTVGIKYEVRLAKVGGKGTITAEVGIQVDFWIYFGMGGQFELGWGEYDIDYGASAMTQTEITFTIGLMTNDAKKAVNINDEIEAIYNSAKDPSPENLLEQYNELMSGGSKPIELFNKNIFKVPVLSMLGGLVEISVPIRFVISLDVEATFSSYVTVLTANAFGLEGNEDTGLDAYHESLPERYTYRLELRGHIELRAGAEMGIELSLGYGLATVSLNVQAGVYAELYGYFFYEIESMSLYGGVTSMNKGGAYYFEFGAYIDIRVRAEVCKIKYSGSLWDKKWPFFSVGQKEIVYGFENPTSDVIEMVDGVGYVYINDSDLLNVYVYDITEERGENNPRLVENYPYSPLDFTFSFSNDNFDIGYMGIAGENKHDYMIYCSNINYLTQSSAIEATLAINYKGVQPAFRDTLTKYVKVRYSVLPSSVVDWNMVDKTCRVSFNVDGKTVFYRNIRYGAMITDQPDIIHSAGSDGKVIVTDLSESEQAAMDKAGITYAEWEINQGKRFLVTEDVTFEANMKNLKRRKLKVTFENGSEIESAEYYYGEEITLPLPENANITTTREVYQFAGWRTEKGYVYSAGNVYKVTGDVTFSSGYRSTPRKYTVTFDGNGGTVGNNSAAYEMVVNYGSMAEYPFTPEKEGTDNVRYEFIGWSPKLAKVTGDVTYKAQWKEIKLYTVTFSAGDGQFDAFGNKTVTIKVAEGQALSESDFPVDPHLKGDGGYYEFAGWSTSVSAGTVITGDVTYTASYKNELIRKTGITVSDGVNTEDIAVFLDGKNKVSGYTYTLNAEYYGNVLEITAPGLTVSGSASDINISVINTDVTLSDLVLIQNARVEVISAKGEVTINIKGTVELTANTDAEAVRGDSYGEYDSVTGEYTHIADAHIKLQGASGESKLSVNAQAYGIAVYGALTVEELDVDIDMPTALYEDQEGGEIYGAVALQVHNHPKGILTVNDSDITVNGGVVNAAWLNMTNSDLIFTAEKFVPGYSSGLDIMNYNEMTTPEALIVLHNSNISFNHGIAIAFSVSLTNGAEYYVNTSLDEHAIQSAYPSLDAFLEDVNTKGYGGMVEIDGNSSIE